MAYSAGMLNKRITIAKRVTGTTPTSATDTGKARYEILDTVWAAETWNKGAKAMQAGVLDAYDTVMFRMRYRSDVDRWCLIQYHGRWYQIQSLNSDYQENQLQITATEMANQKVMINGTVDLGLPSGLLWAKCNVGATKETDYGNFYEYGAGATQYNPDSHIDYRGEENPLDATKDTATQVMGAAWHMPTIEQFNELIANTTYTWQTDFNGSGINGAKFTAVNGNYIFFPAAGYYSGLNNLYEGTYAILLSATPNGKYMAKTLGCRSNGPSTVTAAARTSGLPVRGVMKI